MADPIQANLLATSLATFAATGNIGNALSNTVFNIPGIGHMLLGQIIGAQLNKLLSGWKLDDTASAAAFAAHAAAEKLLGFLQGQIMDMAAPLENAILANVINPILEGIGASGFDVGEKAASAGFGKQLREFFLGIESSATLGVVKQDDPDNMSNKAFVPTAHQVLAHNLPVATFLESTMVPAGKPIIDGSTSVFTGDIFTARATCATAVPSTLLMPATGDVLVGGPSPNPAAVSAALAALAGNAKLGLADAMEMIKAGDAAADASRSKGKSKNEIDNDAQAGANAVALDKKTALELAEAVYRDGKKSLLGGTPEKAIEPNEVLANGWKVSKILDADKDMSLPNGYRAVLFTSPDGKTHALVFAGTNFESGPDLLTDVLQGLGFVPEQYQRAAQDAASLRNDYPGLTIVGHSLGGSLAGYAAGMTGTSVTVLNPAGLGAGSRQNIAANGFPIRPTTQVHEMDNDAITQYLNVLGGKETGHVNIYKTPDGMDPFSAHQTGEEGGLGVTRDDPPIASIDTPDPLPPVV